MVNPVQGSRVPLSNPVRAVLIFFASGHQCKRPLPDMQKLKRVKLPIIKDTQPLNSPYAAAK